MIKIFVIALTTTFLLAGCEQKPQPQLKLISFDKLEECLAKAGVDTMLRPTVIYDGPGMYTIRYEANGVTMRVDCTNFM